MSAKYHLGSDQTGWAQKSIQSYILGFVLCLILTIVSFKLVHANVINKNTIFILLACFAIAQLFIQSICFLGLKSDTNGQWNLLPFLFTLLIIFFLVGGSLWIMYNLNELMMTGPMGV